MAGGARFGQLSLLSSSRQVAFLHPLSELPAAARLVLQELGLDPLHPVPSLTALSLRQDLLQGGAGAGPMKLKDRGFLPLPGTLEKEAQLRSLLCSSEHLEL